MIKFWLYFFLCFFVSPVWAGLGDEFSQQFREVLIDLRNSRGGNGDVAAGYLTLMHLLSEYRVQNHFTLLVDAEGKKRLSSLISENHPLPANVEVQTLAAIDKNREIDFYMALASPSGTLKNNLNQDLKFSPQAILMIQTVLGNTENPASINPMGLIEVDGLKINMPPAGIGPRETGIYGDPVAAFLRGRTEEQSREFLLEEISGVENENTRDQLRGILTKQSLQGSRVGLVYGISSLNTRPQFASYLQGLAQQPSDSFCLITPSEFDLSSFQEPNLKKRLIVLNANATLPTKAEPGKIYVLTTPNLPHPVFVGLTYYSMKQGVTPLGAGDGFLSAGIILGEPFVLTRVPWNADNIKNFKRLLKKQSGSSNSQLNELLTAIYDDLQFDRALELQTYSSLYTELLKNTLLLTESILKVALQLKKWMRENPREIENEKSLEALGLSLRKEHTAIRTGPELVDVYTEFLKTTMADSADYPAEIKAKILNYYSQTKEAPESTSAMKCSFALE